MSGERITRRAIPVSPLEQPPDLGTRRLERSAPARRLKLELVCARCGYGTVTANPLRCPRCGGGVWDFAAWRPFRR